jgi:TonB family protein
MPSAEPVELNYLLLKGQLLEGQQPRSFRRLLRDAAGSVLVHALALVLILSLPEVEPVRQAPVITADLKKEAVHLVAPRFYEPTQKAPNKGKLRRELDVRSAVEAPPRQAPRFRPPAPPPGRTVPAQPVLEPPKINVATPAAPTPTPGSREIAALPPPTETPKLTLENLPGNSNAPVRPDASVKAKIELPKASTSVEEAARAVMAHPSGGGGLTVGDIGEMQSGVPGVAPSPSRVGSQLQLLSDPQNVDFQPYLIQLLSVVRKNWMTIIPQSARMGRRGVVVIQFIVDRRGGVPKLVIASPSGTEALDRAAVAGISASYPFPPLPAGYKGDQIRLQMAFSYNMRPR